MERNELSNTVVNLSKRRFRIIILFLAFFFFYGAGLISKAFELTPYPEIEAIFADLFGVDLSVGSTPSFNPNEITDVELAANVPALIRLGSTGDVQTLRNAITAKIWGEEGFSELSITGLQTAETLDWDNLVNLKTSQHFVVPQANGLDAAFSVLHPKVPKKRFIVLMAPHTIPRNFLDALLGQGRTLALVFLPTQEGTPNPVVNTDHGLIAFTSLHKLHFLRMREAVGHYVFTPVTQAISFLDSLMGSECIDIIGIHDNAMIAIIQAAIDKRICNSYSFNARAPQFVAREPTHQTSFAADIYLQANRLELMTMAGLGRGRSHTQIQLAHDINSGVGQKLALYVPHIAARIQSLGGGSFIGIVDNTTNQIKISEFAQHQVLQGPF
jgi:hypothetical protein